MKAAVIVFPGSNCDRDVAVSLEAVTGTKPLMAWHRDTELPRLDLIVVPGGFSYGDYLRSGAMAAHSPILQEVKRRADAGVHVLGICNGFQILTEAGLLPGVLMRNRGLKFCCKDVHLTVSRNDTAFAGKYRKGQVIRIPIAHADGNFFASSDMLARIEDEGQVAFRYCDEEGNLTDSANPNGSLNNIAGVYNMQGNVLGLMPHPERLAEAELGGTDGRPMFDSLLEALK
ncbi:MAG: phosphoribosylformylglycinamidine synthase subunit PurQ [Alphaproteobacteria bacterium]|nr:phosphoribosylformylglycinamidine synthase subunit PurQ [Alphaproteobacteria bacterium]